jgi:hypothetical protein
MTHREPPWMAVYAGDAWPLQLPVAALVGSSLLILAIFVSLAVYRYRTATAP